MTERSNRPYLKSLTSADYSLRWIQLSAAFQRIRTRPPKAGDEIPLILLSWIKSGLLRTRAIGVVIDGKLCRKVELPPGLWMGPGLVMNWEASTLYSQTFHVTSLGVEVDPAELDELLQTSGLEGTANSRAGAPGKVAVWHQFYAELMRLIDTGELLSFSTQASLRDHLCQAVGESLTDETIKKHVRLAWIQYREGRGDLVP